MRWKMTTQEMEQLSGLNLKDTARKLWEGVKGIYIDQMSPDAVGKDIYFVDDRYAYGIMKFSKKNDFEIIERFSQPKEIHTDPNELFIDKVSFGLEEFRFTPAEQDCIGRKMSILKKEGIKGPQAVAIAISTCAPKKARKSNSMMLADLQSMKKLSTYLYLPIMRFAEDLVDGVTGTASPGVSGIQGKTFKAHGRHKKKMTCSKCGQEVSHDEIKDMQLDLNFPESYKFYSNIDELSEHLFGKNEEKIYAVEKDYDGTRIIAHKKDDVVILFSNRRVDITSEFSEIADELLRLSQEDFIIDGKIISNQDSTKFYVFDILKLGTQDLTEKKWIDRYRILKNMEFTQKVNPVYSMITRDRDQLKNAITIAKNLPQSNGAIIKDVESKYFDRGIKFLS